MNEPLGVLAIACPDEAPLLAFTSLWAPAVAMGNRVVVVPSQTHPLAATDFYQVLETSDMPAGVVNIVTGARAELTKTMAEHNGVEAIWYFGTDGKTVEQASAADLKRTWIGEARDWLDASAEEGISAAPPKSRMSGSRTALRAERRLGKAAQLCGNARCRYRLPSAAAPGRECRFPDAG